MLGVQEMELETQWNRSNILKTLSFSSVSYKRKERLASKSEASELLGYEQ